MLVLTRKVHESIAIGDSIVVTVVSVDGGKARLGITAPIEVKILRSDLPVTQLLRTQFCARCRRWVEPSVYDGSERACDDCAQEGSGKDDDERFDGVDDIHEIDGVDAIHEEADADA